MQDDFITEFFSSTLTPWNDMVDLNNIVVLEVQSTQEAFPALLLQELAFPSIEQRMPAQSLTPIREVAIIGAGRSLHFDVVLDMGAIM
jgi:hypothetical protein